MTLADLVDLSFGNVVIENAYLEKNELKFMRKVLYFYGDNNYNALEYVLSVDDLDQGELNTLEDILVRAKKDLGLKDD